MKKIIALAALSLSVGACDPYEDEPGGTPQVIQAMVSGRLSGPWFDNTADGTGLWTPDTTYGEDAEGNLIEVPENPAESAGSDGRIVVVKTNVLLDGASIEATPQSCVPAGNWLNVTTAPAGLTGGTWYTCYFPGTPTTLEGASVLIYYSALAPGVLTANAPLRAGRLVAGDYAMNGTIRAKNGTPIDIRVAFTVVVPPA